MDAHVFNVHTHSIRVTQSVYSFFFQSIAFHDNGKKHQEMVELKLKSIRNKGKLEERQAKRADSWVKIMEEKAMKVFKDLLQKIVIFFSEKFRLEVYF